MKILAIDPGPRESGWALLDHKIRFGVWPNKDILTSTVGFPCDVLVIEEMECFGMAVGRSVFDTVKFMGRIWEAWHRMFHTDPIWLPRRDVKMHLCGSMRAKDPNIHAAVADRFGGSIKAAKGTKKAPGPLYGIKSDAWSALALAITFAETHKGVTAWKPKM